MEPIDDGVDIDDVLEDLHADDAVVRAATAVAVQVRNVVEGDTRQVAQPLAAVVHLRGIELGPDRGRRSIGGRAQQREKSAVAAAVVEQSLAAERRRQLQSRLEPTTVTPRDQAILAVDLLGGVVAAPEGRVGGVPV